jgi:maleylacetoacetate isomerase/maleylpyruvate isomerase
LRLYTYHRNSAGERVRIALNLKGLAYDYVSAPALGLQYRGINSQGLMPALEVDGAVIAQSAAILEYLEECHPVPGLLPESRLLRAQARAFAQLIAADTHPLNNNRVHRYLAREVGLDEGQRRRWREHWIAESFAALETTLSDRATPWPFCFGETPGWADLHLVPQLRNARRFDIDLAAYPLLTGIEARCIVLDAFIRAPPERQPDFPSG